MNAMEKFSERLQVNGNYTIYRPMGGLGNQLYQLAAARQVARDRGTVLLYESHAMDRLANGRRPGTFRRLSIHKFENLFIGNASVRRDAKIVSMLGENRLLDPFLRLAVAPVITKVTGLKIHEESGFGYKPIPDIEPGSPLFLIGNFQSWLYFREVNTEICSEIVSSFNPSAPSSELSDRVAVHMRFGDYVGSKKFTSLGRDYYIEAMREALNTAEAKVEIVSDEPEKADECLQKWGFKTRGRSNIQVLEKKSEEVAFQRLSTAKNVVTANSTFSWWAGRVAESQGSQVYTPARWFEDGRSEATLLPDTWKKI